MSVIDRLLVSSGIAGATLQLKLGSPTYPRGGTITGEVVLKGGRVEQRFHSLRVRLLDYFGNTSNSDAVRDEQILAAHLRMTPQASVVYPFTFQLSDDAALSVSQANSGWRVEARAHTMWAVNPRVGAAFHVIPQPEIMAVKLAFETLGFAPVSPFGSMTLDEGPNTIGDYYLADSRRREQLDGAWLYIQNFGARGAYVFGRLVLNRHPQGVGKQLRALIAAEREEYAFHIPRSNLLTAKGKPSIEGALSSLESILARALPPEDVNARTLLRPSISPGDRSTLLRPAASNSSTLKATLLHPATPPESRIGESSPPD